MRWNLSRVLVAVLVVAVDSGSLRRAWAEDNVDPANNGAQYAWDENVGWQNAEPKPPGGVLPGVLVDESNLTGYIWSENVGWISLSCENRQTCASASYGIQNDGQGNLSGFAWSENAGWIKFAPEVAGTPVGGVKIDPVSGIFSGTAWGENIGWINFTFPLGIAPFQVKTSWFEGAPTFTPTRTPTRTPTGNTPTPSATATVTVTGTRSPSPGPTTLPSPPGRATWPVLLLLVALMSLRVGRRSGRARA